MVLAMRVFDRAVLQFLALAFGFSWAVGAFLAFTGGFATPGRQVVGGFIFMTGPAIAALVTTRRDSAADRREHLGWRLRFDRWLLVAWLVPIVVLVVASLGAGLFAGTHLTSPAAALAARLTELSGPDEAAKLNQVPGWALSLALVLQTTVLGAAFNTPFMLSEELGWRGVLWARWQDLGFWPQSLATGVVWGVWHAPLILMGYNFPDAPVLGVALMTLFCVLLAPLFQLVRLRGGTIWHACLCHGTINAGARLSELCVSSEHWYGRGILGVSGFVTLAAVCVGVVLFKRYSER